MSQDVPKLHRLTQPLCKIAIFPMFLFDNFLDTLSKILNDLGANGTFLSQAKMSQKIAFLMSFPKFGHNFNLTQP